MDDMLGTGRLDEGDSIELAQESDEPTKICSGGWAMEPACSVARASRSLEMKTLVLVVNLVVCKSLSRKLEILDWDGQGGEELDAENPGFFHLERINCQGQPDGAEDHSNPSDDSGETLALVWGWLAQSYHGADSPVEKVNKAR